jgi:hypothetical protein
MCWLFLVVLVLHCQAVPIISLQNLSPNGQNVSKRGLRAGRRCRPFVSSQIYYFSLFGCRNPTYGIDEALLSTLAPPPSRPEERIFSDVNYTQGVVSSTRSLGTSRQDQNFSLARRIRQRSYIKRNDLCSQ